jgi:hypothetical protein
LIAVEPVLLRASIHVIVIVRAFLACSVDSPGELANQVELEVTRVPGYVAL